LVERVRVRAQIKNDSAREFTGKGSRHQPMTTTL
jgi:hypothetical protein